MRTGNITSVFLIAMMVPWYASAQLPGKIVGHVSDQETDELLQGVNIVVVGTYLGAATDSEGDYMIINVSPSLYELQATMIGYEVVRINGVEVLSDLTTHIDFQMVGESLKGEEITITAERPLIQEDVTTSVNYIGKEELNSMPASDYNDLLVLNPGMTRDAKGFHLRGGRSREIVVQVDGIPIQEPNYGTAFAGYSALSLNSNAISEISVQSGGFNAEFGNALSGIIDVSTGIGSDRFSWSFDAESELPVDDGAAIPTDKQDSLYYDGSRYDYISGYTRYRFGLGGPVTLISPKMRYSASAQWLEAEDGLPTRENTENDFVELVVNGKLGFLLGSRINLTVSGMMSEKEYDLFDVRRKYIPETFQRRHALVQQFSLNWNQTLSSNLYYSVLAGYSRTYYKAAQPGKWWDITQVEDWNILNPDDPADTLNPEAIQIITDYKEGTQYIIGGDNNLFREEDLRIFLLKGALTWQAGKHNQFKTGFELHRYDLFYQAVLAYKGFPFTFAHGFGNEQLNLPDLNPILLGLFLQDKIEFKGMVMNVGIRYDMFDPDAVLPSSFWYPYLDPGDMGPDLSDQDYWTGPNHDIPVENPAYPWKQASIKHMISPRLGVSHPLTDRTMLHFTYGQFYQIPDWYLLYRNYNYSYDILALYGNPDMRPEATTSFEVGARSAVMSSLVIDFTAFYKDIRDLVETTIANNLNDPDFQAAKEEDDSIIELPTWFVNDNLAWGNSKGLEFTLRHFPTHRIPLGVNLSYTFMVAKGKTSDYHDGFLRIFTRGQLEPVQEYYLNWDQRHTVNLSVDYRWSESSGLNLLTRYGSGYPYTGYQESLLPVENNERLPSTMQVDLKANHAFEISGVKANIYLLVINLFDKLNVVNFDNGENRRIPVIPHLLDHPSEFEGPLDDPMVFGPHREIRVGVSFSY